MRWVSAYSSPASLKSAKTGALASLATGGYTLRYCNLDDNAEPLFAFSPPTAHKNIQVLDCIDQFRVDAKGDLVVDGVQGLKSWKTIVGAMDKWPLDGSDPAKWGARDVLVIDSLTELAKGLARRQQTIENRQNTRYSWNDYDRVQKQVDAMLIYLKSKLPKASLAVICHLQLIGPDLGTGDIEDDDLKEEVIRQKLRGADIVPWKLAPISLGRAQGKTLAGHFTGTLYCKATSGRGRVILTQPEDGFDAGVPVAGLPRELPVADGMAKIFNTILGFNTPATPKPSAPARPR